MEPFNIICKTCAARLKVRKKSLVGQTLGCPKCGAMVKVQAPEGWLVEPDEDSKIAADSNSGSQFESGNFDDIESLIQREQNKPSQVSSLPAPTTPQPTKRPQKRASELPTADLNQPGVEHLDEPLLPNQSWASSESKKRQKLVMILAASLAGLLLIGTAIAAIVTNANSNNEEVADKAPLVEDETDSQIDSDVSDPAKADGSDDPGTENESVNTDVESQTNTNDPPVGQSVDPSVEQPTEIPTPKQGGSSTDNSTDIPEGNPEETDPDTETPLVPKVNDPEDPKDPQQKEDPLFDLGLEDNQPSTFVDPILGDPLGVDTIATRMGELNSLLAENGATLGEIGSIAKASQDMELVGIPKYFMEKPPTTKPVNITLYLGNDIAGIQYQGGASLLDFSRDMGTLIGAPVSLHVESLQAAGRALNPQLDFKRTDLELSQAIDVVLAEVGLIKVQTDFGLVVLAKGWNVPTQKRFATHRMADTSPEGLASFVRRVRGMFADEAWTEKTAIEFKGDELVVTQQPQVSAQIKFFLEKLIAAQALKADPNDEAAKQTLQTRWASSKSAREAKIEFRPGPARTITRFLMDIERQADVRILVDWNSLARQGWTPKTLVPGQFEEPTVGDSLAQLARGLGVTYRAVGEKTFELLTFQEAADRPELQIYPANEIVKDTFKSSDLMEILRSTVRVDPKLIQISYDEDIEGVVVIAPQSVQRQFEAVMNRLRGPKP